MRRLINLFATVLAAFCPPGVIARIYRLSLGTRHLTMCLHRVCDVRRPTDPYPANTIERDKLIRILALVGDFHQKGPSRLTLSFDDGYTDAIDFVKTHAPRHPYLGWIVFICPIKLEKRLGFRWDRFEIAQHGETDPAMMILKKQLDARTFPQLAPGENLYLHINMNPDPELDARDPSLRIFPDCEPFRLTTLADLGELAGIPGVRLGNHSNSHMRFSHMSPERALAEIKTSLEDMQRLLGPFEDFAIPFGTPARDYQIEHIELLRRSGIRRIWTTYSAPYEAQELVEGAVLPRFVIIGTWSYQRILLYMALTSLYYRLRRSTPITKYLALSKTS